MTKTLTLMVFLLGTLLCSQAKAGSIDFYNYYIGLQLQGISLDDQSDQGLDDSAWTAGVFYKARLKDYFQFAVGVDYFYTEDKAPFEQEVNDKLSDETRSVSSDVTGLSWYLEAGVQYKFPPEDRWTLGLLAGYRYSNISRGILACSGCEDQELPDFKNAAYLKPFVEYQWTKSVITQLFFTQYVSGDQFENGLGLQITVWAM
ncbi:porin family protein [Shewanella submarina]|uniref:Outer membrane beta-barrel protein n=1 Tax=Shewanella submarina TaxID=2016376 RepID=A0ABV7G850_9GAMM|nr:outer membrane beta-barrel protein [Shewanella submarina]MCL1038561.1 porin family protein [Shewanella submarina]